MTKNLGRTQFTPPHPSLEMTGLKRKRKYMSTLIYSVHKRRPWINFWFLIVIGSLLVGTLGTPIARASDPIEVGYRDFSYPSGTGGNSEPTGEKPESKLWWNDGFWWGSLWSSAGNAYHIYRLDLATQDWVDTETAIDDRSDSRADMLWDGQHLYGVSHIFAKNAGQPAPPSERGRLYRYSYDAGAQTYSLDAGFPVEVTGGKSETLVLVKDSTGRLWVTYVENQQVMVNHSLNGDDSTWGTPFVLPGAANVTSDDISSIVAFDGKIGVMWSDQNSPKTMYFARHIDGEPDNIWQSTAAYTTSGDDHINLKSLENDGAGNLFAVIKTSNSSALIVLLVCTSGTDCRSFSDWTAYPVYQSSPYRPTRPILLIDTSNRDLYVFTRNNDSSGNSGIYYKTVDMDNIQFPDGIGVPFIRSATDTGINDPASTKQNVNTATGLVVLASDAGPDYYFHNYLDLSGGINPVITGFTPASGTEGAVVTITGSNFSGATEVAFNGVPDPGFSLISDNELQAAAGDQRVQPGERAGGDGGDAERQRVHGGDRGSLQRGAGQHLCGGFGHAGAGERAGWGGHRPDPRDQRGGDGHECEQFHGDYATWGHLI
jgi:hypothetical protein